MQRVKEVRLVLTKPPRLVLVTNDGAQVETTPENVFLGADLAAQNVVTVAYGDVVGVAQMLGVIALREPDVAKALIITGSALVDCLSEQQATTTPDWDEWLKAVPAKTA